MQRCAGEKNTPLFRKNSNYLPFLPTEAVCLFIVVTPTTLISLLVAMCWLEIRPLLGLPFKTLKSPRVKGG